MPEILNEPGLVFFLVGLTFIIGSFLNVCIARMPMGESVVWPRSRCPFCRAQIAWYDNVPVFSYLLLRGKCRACSAKIPFRYLAVEILFPLLMLFVVLKEPHWQAWPYAGFLMAALIISTFIDIDHWIIPDKITLPGIVIGLAGAALLPDRNLIDSLIGFCIGGGILFLIGTIYMRWKNIEGIGGGDVKFLAMAGAFLGAKSVLVALVLASLLGSLYGAYVMLRRGSGSQTAVQFGPFLALGTLIAYLFGGEIAAWYLQSPSPIY